MTDYRGTLNDAQLAVLRWVEAGCPPGVMEGYAHRVSAAALRSRDLVKITGRGKTWKAVITPAGRECLDPGPREPARSGSDAAEQKDRSSVRPPAASQEAPAAARTDLPAPIVRAARLSCPSMAALRTALAIAAPTAHAKATARVFSYRGKLEQ